MANNKFSIIDPFFLWVMRRLEKLSRRVIRLKNERLKSQMKTCGKGTELNGRQLISHPEMVELGNNVHISENSHISAQGGLVIGDNTHIARNLVLYTQNHRYQGDLLPYNQHHDSKPVTIGRNVWIGMNVCIVPGTTIGQGAIIGMGTVVSGNVEPLAIIGSIKWRVLKHRDKDHHETLDKAGKYSGRNGRAIE